MGEIRRLFLSMDFSELPPEIHEHIFGFVGENVHKDSFSSKMLYEVFLHNKREAEKKTLEKLLEKKSVFSCLPKFFLEFTEERVVECEKHDFVLPIKVQLRLLSEKNREGFLSLCRDVGTHFPSARSCIPESGRRAFSFGVGRRIALGRKVERNGTLFPELACGFVFQHALGVRMRRSAVMLCRIWLSEEFEEHDKEESLTKLSAMLEWLGREDFLCLAPPWSERVEEIGGILPNGTEELMCLMR